MTDIPTHINRIKQGRDAYVRLLKQENEAMFAEAKQHYDETNHYIEQIQEAGDAHAAGIHERFLKNASKSDGMALEAVERELQNATRQ